MNKIIPVCLFSICAEMSFGAVCVTERIQREIDACSACGGGVVEIGPGEHKIGTLWLKSGVELHLQAGAVLLGSEDRGDYNALDAYPQNWHSKNEGWTGAHLIIAHEQTNVSITGEGAVDGNASAFFSDHPSWTGKIGWRKGACDTKDGGWRPGQEIVFVECRNVRVEGVTLRNMSCWSCYFHGCENVRVGNVRVRNDPRHLQTDGFDVDCCSDVRIGDCDIRTGDDAFAIRANPRRLKNASRPCENVVISNCVCKASSSGVRIGVGTGLVRNVCISGLQIDGAGRGLQVQCSYGKTSSGANIEDVRFSDITMRDVAQPIRVTSGTASCTARLERVSFERIQVESYGPIHVVGGRQTVVRDVRLCDVNLMVVPFPAPLPDFPGIDSCGTSPQVPIYVARAEKIRLENVNVSWGGTAKPWWDVALQSEAAADVVVSGGSMEELLSHTTKRKGER